MSRRGHDLERTKRTKRNHVERSVVGKKERERERKRERERERETRRGGRGHVRISCTIVLHVCVGSYAAHTYAPHTCITRIVRLPCRLTFERG